MDQFQGTFGQKIAWAARSFEQRRTKHGRQWVAVFMNEDTIAIALHSSLTPAGRILTQSPAGAAQVLEFHQQLFANDSATLLQEIKSITGMEVRGTTQAIEPTTGSVVQIFTTDTVGGGVPGRSGKPMGTSAPGYGPPRWYGGNAGREATKTGSGIRSCSPEFSLEA